MVHLSRSLSTQTDHFAACSLACCHMGPDAKAGAVRGRNIRRGTELLAAVQVQPGGSGCKKKKKKRKKSQTAVKQKNNMVFLTLRDSGSAPPPGVA